LKREVGKYAPQFSGYAQRDAHEFLIALLDGLQDQIMKTTAAASAFSIIEQLFNIQLISQMTCRACEVTGSGTESIKFLSLPLPDKSNDPITLSSLLDLFEKELDGQIYCDSCGQIARGRQKTRLDILPRSLLFNSNDIVSEEFFNNFLLTRKRRDLKLQLLLDLLHLC
ncbi:unnamed protein product, partial [Didymodactylos carnosus]